MNNGKMSCDSLLFKENLRQTTKLFRTIGLSLFVTMFMMASLTSCTEDDVETYPDNGNGSGGTNQSGQIDVTLSEVTMSTIEGVDGATDFAVAWEVGEKLGFNNSKKLNGQFIYNDESLFVAEMKPLATAEKFRIIYPYYGEGVFSEGSYSFALPVEQTQKMGANSIKNYIYLAGVSDGDFGTQAENSSTTTLSSVVAIVEFKFSFGDWIADDSRILSIKLVPKSMTFPTSASVEVLSEPIVTLGDETYSEITINLQDESGIPGVVKGANPIVVQFSTFATEIIAEKWLFYIVSTKDGVETTSMMYKDVLAKSVDACKFYSYDIEDQYVTPSLSIDETPINVEYDEVSDILIPVTSNVAWTVESTTTTLGDWFEVAPRGAETSSNVIVNLTENIDRERSVTLTFTTTLEPVATKTVTITQSAIVPEFTTTSEVIESLHDGGDQSITVTSNVGWTAIKNGTEEWYTITTLVGEKGEVLLTTHFTPYTNGDAESRTATFTVTTNGDNLAPQSKVITVKQWKDNAIVAELTVAKNHIISGNYANTITLDIASNVSWKAIKGAVSNDNMSYSFVNETGEAGEPLQIQLNANVAIYQIYTANIIIETTSGIGKATETIVLQQASPIETRAMNFNHWVVKGDVNFADSNAEMSANASLSKGNSNMSHKIVVESMSADAKLTYYYSFGGSNVDVILDANTGKAYLSGWSATESAPPGTFDVSVNFDRTQVNEIDFHVYPTPLGKVLAFYLNGVYVTGVNASVMSTSFSSVMTGQTIRMDEGTATLSGWWSTDTADYQWDF